MWPKTGCPSPTFFLHFLVIFHFVILLLSVHLQFSSQEPVLMPRQGFIQKVTMTGILFDCLWVQVCVSLDVVSNPPSPRGAVGIFSFPFHTGSFCIAALPPLPVPSMPPLTKSRPGSLCGGGDTTALMTGHWSSASASPCRLTCNTLTSLHSATALSCVPCVYVYS